jgi:predicted enzyme related to lactoylglutathione lyase
MNAHVSVIMLGVRDMDQAKQFYGEGLGWPIAQDYGQFVSFKANDGSSGVALYPWEAVAADAGVLAEGSGFRGFSLHYLVRSEDRVDAVLAEAEKAGGTIVRPAEKTQWGYFGYFGDPDGFLWKVASGGGDQPFAE